MPKHVDVKRIIISRTDSIGDVMLTLPMCGLLKSFIPGIEIVFLGRSYTKDIIACCAHVDSFLNYDDAKDDEALVAMLKSTRADGIIHVFPMKRVAFAAKKAGIATRIGTSHRWYHWLTCNERVPLSRKDSPLHESHLNILLAEKITGRADVHPSEVMGWYGFSPVGEMPEKVKKLIQPGKRNIIVHMMSKGSARNWPPIRWMELVEQCLLRQGAHVLLTGTADDKIQLEAQGIAVPEGVTQTMGALSLSELIHLIAAADGLVACSTGPLHIASALGKVAVGIYPPKKPMHPGRWAPVGRYAAAITGKEACVLCKDGGECACMQAIETVKVAAVVLGLCHEKENKT